MTERFWKCFELYSVAGLVLVTALACNADAGVLRQTCNLVYKRLGSGPYESLTKSTGSFIDHDKRYYGCVIHLSGNINEVADTQRPYGLFGRPLPYCPGGKLPEDLPHELVNGDGWCDDRIADGPDGTSYRALKKGIFCAVEGLWDGGDDSDPDYVPSPRYDIIVKCANR